MLYRRFATNLKEGEEGSHMKGTKQMKQMLSKLAGKAVLSAVALAAVVGLAPVADAQSTIFNIPTTDVVSPKKGYFEFDYLVQMPKTEDTTRAQVFVPRVVVGGPTGLEVGANFATYHYGEEANYVYFQPNAKYRFFANDDSGWAASAGIIGYLPVNHMTEGEVYDRYALVYGNVSKKVKTGNYGPRITVGPYGIVGAEDYYYGTKAGVIVGYEQPVHPRVSIVADWFSGVSGFGYFTPGISFTLPKNGLLNFGYSIGNDSYKDPGNNNRYFFAYYGITFP
jgi:hypothetical protein